MSDPRSFSTLWSRLVFSTDRWIIRDIVVNLVLYMPLGVAAYGMLRNHLSARVAAPLAIAIGAVLSSAVEILQLWTPSRASSIRDILTNTAGTGIGVGFGHAALGFLGSQNRNNRRADSAAATLLIAMVAWLFVPFLPIRGTTALAKKFAAFLDPAMTDLVPVASMAVIWLAAGHMIRAVLPRRAVAIQIAATALIPGQILISGRQPALLDLIGAWAGCALFAGGAGPRVCAAMLVAMLLVLGLMPGRSTHHPAGFSWIPFIGFVQQDWFAALRVLMDKIVYDGTSIWMLRRSGLRSIVATMSIAVLLGAIEAAQLWIPGRSPGTTDPVLAMLLGFVLMSHYRPTRGGMDGIANVTSGGKQRRSSTVWLV